MKSKWNDFYKTEEDLISDMLLTYTDDRKDYWKVCKGYEYINGFKKYFYSHGCLTPAQLTQLKRLAAEVYKNVHEVQKK